MTTNADWAEIFDAFNWDEYFTKLNANPQGNIHAGCDHANGYCATTTTNTFNGA